MKAMNKMTPPTARRAAAYAARLRLFHGGAPRPEETHTLSVLVDNEPGVLARVIGLFSGRGYNIESLTVSETQHAQHLSRITVVTTGTRAVLEQIRNQLDRLVSVHRVTDLTEIARRRNPEELPLERELALVKVAGTGEKRIEALRLADAFKAEVVDATTEHFIFQLTGRTVEDRAVHRHHGADGPGRGLPHRRRRDGARRGGDVAQAALWLTPLMFPLLSRC